MLAFIPQGILMTQREGGMLAGVIYGYLALPILYFIFAFVFLKYADPIAQKLDGEGRNISIDPDEDWSKTLYNAGVRLIGVYVVVTAVPDVINQALQIFSMYQTHPFPSLRFWSVGIAAVIYLGLGLHLLAGGSLLSKLTDYLNRHND